ncbi:MAG TPA: coenzyme F420-0:L-glutamate ligase [Nitrososphaerales archaeon]|nr:coenzyme F420-0:L-glutamate ligase [Nitrososphaerales archaeon]
MTVSRSIEIIPVDGIQEVSDGHDIGQLILDACKKNRVSIKNGDVIVVTHKIISKAEGRVLDLSEIIPSSFAKKSGKHIGKDPRQVEVILSESRRLVKMVKGLIIAETLHGFVCANAGVDQSNIDLGKIVLLPTKPDESARKIREKISQVLKIDVAVIISDTFGRPWREGQIDVAIGISGIDPFVDYRGKTDQYGYNLRATVICIADELASAAELCMNKLDRVPVAIIRGYPFSRKEISAKLIARRPARDLFR